MNWKHLLWIVPLSLILGGVMGWELAFPNKLTIDYGDDVILAIEKMEELSNRQNMFDDAMEIEDYQSNITIVPNRAR